MKTARQLIWVMLIAASGETSVFAQGAVVRILEYRVDPVPVLVGAGHGREVSKKIAKKDMPRPPVEGVERRKADGAFGVKVDGNVVWIRPYDVTVSDPARRSLRGLDENCDEAVAGRRIPGAGRGLGEGCPE